MARNPLLERTLRILVVELEDGTAELVRRSSAGVEVDVRVCRGVEPATIALEQETPDAVILELGPNGLDDVEALVRTSPMVPVLVLASSTDESVAIKALESGAQDYLVKDECTAGLLGRTLRYSIERKRFESELLQAARFDVVTGLANRSYFLGLLEHALDRARRNRTTVDVLFLDLDHFKNINDSMGHAAGDELLRQVGQRIKCCVRASDVVARLGGDEFTVMLEEGEVASSASIVAHKILAAMHRPFLVDGVEVVVTPSVGIAGYPGAGADAHALLQHADTAMYRAKSKGRNTVEFYTEAMNREARESFELELALRRGLNQGEFEIHYQPIIDCARATVTAVEALLRWQRPDRQGLVQPRAMLPTLERTGLIREVGSWVLATACRQCRQWQETLEPMLRVNVNVSPRELLARGFVDQVSALLERTGLAASSLVIEITEEVWFERQDANLNALNELRTLGVSIAIDDFGAGYASLGKLTTFPFDIVKINRSFVGEVGEQRANAVVTAGILSIARGLGRSVIAEGVETEAQLEFLSEHHCREVQGYLYSEPLSATDFEEFFRRSSVADIAISY